MKQKLSALADGELLEENSGPVLAHLKNDPELRRAWDTWHLIGDALRGELGAETGGRVAARLADEPTVLAPRREGRAFARAAWVALSAAAGIAAVALVTWTALPAGPPDPQLAAMRAPAAGAPAADAQPRPAATTEVYDYLLAHQSYSHSNAMQGLAPYVRTVADEPGVPGR